MQHLHIHAKHSFSLWGMPLPGVLFLFSGCLSTETQMWSAALMIEGELQHSHWPGRFGWCIGSGNGRPQDMQSLHICPAELRHEWGTIAIVKNAKTSEEHCYSSGELCLCMTQGYSSTTFQTTWLKSQWAMYIRYNFKMRNKGSYL